MRWSSEWSSDVCSAYLPTTRHPKGRHSFRVPGRGRLKDLIEHFRRGARPSPGLYAAYAKVGDEKMPARSEERRVGKGRGTPCARWHLKQMCEDRGWGGM